LYRFCECPKATHNERLSLRSNSIAELLYDLDYAPRTGVDQHWPIIDDRIAIFTNAIFLRDVIVGDTRLRKNSAYPYIAFITIRRPVLFDNIMTKARTLVDAQNTVYAADDTTDRAADDCPHRSSSPLTITCAAFNAARYTLRRCRKRDNNDCRQKRRCDYLTKHDEPPC
jgi:hypothetical protein